MDTKEGLQVTILVEFRCHATVRGSDSEMNTSLIPEARKHERSVALVRREILVRIESPRRILWSLPRSIVVFIEVK